MYTLFCMRHYSLSVLLFFLTLPYVIFTKAENNLSSFELHQLRNNPEATYLYCDKFHSTMAEVITQITEFDEDKNSPIWQLKRHIDYGFSIGEKDAIVQALEYGAKIVVENYKQLTEQQADDLLAKLNSVIDAVTNGDLLLDIDFLFNRGMRSVSNNEIDKCCQDAHNQILKVREKLYVLESAKFFKEVEMKDDLDVEKNAKIHGKLKVSGSANIGCDLSVGCNLNIHNSTTPAIGNIVKDGTSFIHNFGTNNTFVGMNSGNFTMTGIDNAAFGALSFSANTIGMYNAAIGAGTMMANTIGAGNTAVGTASLLSNISGNTNTSVGFIAMISHISGDNNTAVGVQALNSNTIGSDNTAIGQSALVLNVTGSGNVALGSNAGDFLVSGDNNIYISHDGMTSESGAIRIGTLGTHTTAFMQGIFGSTVGGSGLPVEVDSTGQLGTVVSSAQFKRNIKDMDAISENIYKLRPVTFSYIGDDAHVMQYGLIAEEVEQLFSDLVVKDKDGNPYSVRYQVLPVLLLNELQKQKMDIKDLTENFVNSIEELKQRIAYLEAGA